MSHWSQISWNASILGWELAQNILGYDLLYWLYCSKAIIFSVEQVCSSIDFLQEMIGVAPKNLTVVGGDPHEFRLMLWNLRGLIEAFADVAGWLKELEIVAGGAATKETSAWAKSFPRYLVDSHRFRKKIGAVSCLLFFLQKVFLKSYSTVWIFLVSPQHADHVRLSVASPIR